MTLANSPSETDHTRGDKPSRRGLLLAGVAAVGAATVLPGATPARAEGTVTTRGQATAAVAAATGTTLSDVDKIAIVATPERFSGLDPSGQNDSAPALKAAIAACPDGGRLIVPTGVYRLASTLSNEGKSISLVGQGATLVRAHPSNSAVLLTGTFESPLGVSSISATTVDAGGGEQPGTSLAVGSSPGWDRGDVVKVFADDEIAEARQESSNKSRLGEFMVVDNVSGRTVSLVGSLNGSYSSNVRVARLINTPVRFEGFRIDTDPAGISAGWGETTVVISALIRPVLRDLHVRIASAAAILMRSCYAYDVENVLIDRAINDPNAGLYGYGILDNSSAYGTIRNLHARRVRHAYTDDTPRVSSNASVVQYGSTYGTRVIDSVCHGASGAGFDTHSCSEFVTFDNCSAIDCREGFSLRGRKHVVRNSSAIRCTTGMQTITESSGTDASWGHRIQDFYGENLSGPGVRIIPRTSSSHAKYNQRETRDVTLSGVTLRNSALPFIQVTNATLEASGLSASASASVSDASSGVVATNSIVRGQDWMMDFQPVTSGSSLRGMQSRLGGSIDLDGLDLRWRDDDNGRVQGAAVGESAVTVTVRQARFSGDLSTPSIGFTRGSSIDWTSKTQASRLIKRTGTAVSNTETARLIYRARDPQIILLCTVTDGQTLPALTESVVLGQILYVVNPGDSAATVTVRHGSAYMTSLRSNANRRMSPNSTLALVWTGTVWQQLV